MLAEREKNALTRQNAGAPGGIRTPNLSLLAKLGAELNLPDITQEVGLRAGQRHAKKAAVARWTRRDDGAETA